jgi:hypothetical protein
MFSSLTQIQVSGLITLGVSTPFLIKSVRNLYLTNASKQWPKISGTIKEFPSHTGRFSMLYEYTVNKNTYKSRKISYTNSRVPKNLRPSEFEKKYALHRIVDVFYNPNNPKQSVLEPGRKDGLLLAIIILSILFVFGCLAVFDPGFFLQLLGSYFQII